MAPRAALALGAVFGLLAGCAGAADFDRAPIIVIDVDTLRADHLGCYGYERPTSPQIDAFAREAVLFRWAFSQAPNTGPSQASILTSLYPRVHGRVAWGDELGPAVVTLAEVLRARGYATAAFVDGGMMAREFGYEQGFDVYDDEAGGVAVSGPKARSFLRERGTEPFFLLVHSYDVHGPYDKTPEPYRSTFLRGLPRPAPHFRQGLHQILRRRNLSRGGPKAFSLSPVEVAYTKALYDGGIVHLDAWFGGFLEFLRRRGLYERSILVLLSDHGEEFEEHDAVLHDQLHSTVTRIPLLVRFPGGQLAREVPEAVESIDVMPTLLSAVGAATPAAAQGRNLMPLIRGAGAFEQRAFSESPFHGGELALADGSLRLIRSEKTGATRLYDYRRDPLEAHELSTQQPERRDALAARLEAWRRRVASAAATVAEGAAEPAPVEDATLEQLRSLGYLDE